jgi:hypothetical protein
MEVKELKKLFGNNTAFTEGFREYAPGFAGASRRGHGFHYFPINGVDCNKAIWLGLDDPKTENLDWISDVFPNIEVLELRDNKQQKLCSLDGIEKLENLKSIVINPQFDREYKLTINKLNSYITELLVWNTKIDLETLNKEMHAIHLCETRVNNVHSLKSINCKRIKIYNLKDLEGNPIGIDNFEGEFKDFKLS